jgi:glycosyltransferase involved in cell wall biosynthesis
MMITATILTFNSEKTIQKTLDSLHFLSEVIVVDTGSTDQTLKIISEYPQVKVFQSEFTGFGPVHNYATSLATHDWILSIDSDEVVSEKLKEKLLSMHYDENCAYSFAFHNIFNGKWIKYSGWYPDYHLRLFNRKKTQFSNHFVHEKVCLDHVKEIKINEPIEHYSYLEIKDFLRKCQVYTDLFAKQNKGRPSSFTKAFSHGLFAFIKTYLIKLGFLDGKEGFIIASYQAQTAFYKYLKLAELNKKC